MFKRWPIGGPSRQGEEYIPLTRRVDSTDGKRMNKICQFHWWDELGVNYLLQGKPHELGVNVKVFLMLEIFKNWSVQQYIEKYSSLLFAPRCHPLSTLCYCQFTTDDIWQVLLQEEASVHSKISSCLFFIRDCRYKAQLLLIIPITWTGGLAKRRWWPQ